jgi:hypothetical protein
LLFLVNNVFPYDNRANIPKTIVYIDNKAGLVKVRFKLIEYLVYQKKFDRATVSAMLGKYYLFTPIVDQKLLYTQFKRVDFHIRIIFATVILGMGINIVDVKRVIQLGEIISK